jgi:hypothetical protein
MAHAPPGGTAMQPLSALTIYALRWIKPSWRKYHFELTNGAQTFATLDINGWVNRATGATAQGTYHFQRIGF